MTNFCCIRRTPGRQEEFSPFSSQLPKTRSPTLHNSSQDRRLDTAVVTAETLAERAQLATRFAAGTHLDSEGILFRRVRSLAVLADPPMSFHAGGEPIGETPLEFEIFPAAIEMFSP